MAIDSTQLARPGLPNDHCSLKGFFCKVGIQSTGLPSLANHKWYKNVNRNRKRVDSRSTPQDPLGDICSVSTVVSIFVCPCCNAIGGNLWSPNSWEKEWKDWKKTTVSTCVEGWEGGGPPAVAMERRHSLGSSPSWVKPFRHRLSSRGGGDNGFIVDETHNLSSPKLKNSSVSRVLWGFQLSVRWVGPIQTGSPFYGI